ncbi:Uncharacterised protein [Zhongshania aliphaticivorans]|uniref:DUF4870 domain-containing protein n=1 Tax=Zhongshania aliphaticivorans TaxID=1470434 RepID=A0A5S9Q036_9GAMM|nr:DUF4870 domain-containing protein [Zhongshania aliphaticivorans]CAA0092833.1 Uncharacterised protein [Zhongshania aliphaticivorans]CAA0110371.1 Uncharacterised protein [Zhongshania aliphaticivorans]
MVDDVVVAPEAKNPEGDVILADTGMAKIGYILYLVGLVVPFAGIAGLVVAYLKKDKASKLEESHFQFIIRTFWIGLLYSLIGIILSFVFIGYFVLLFTAIWYLVRTIKGLILLSEKKPIADPSSWFFG